jgi:signal recognition particle subunit SEC65
MNKSPQEVAEQLSSIYESEFGGKDRGRFKISRSNLRRLAGRKRLEDTTVNKIADAALELGYIVIDLGDYFSVVEEAVMLNYRPVPKSVLSPFLQERAASASDEDD